MNTVFSARSLLLSLSLTTLASPLAFAGEGSGGSNGGGGGAIVCFKTRADRKQITNPDLPIPDRLIPRVRSVVAFDLDEALRPRGSSAQPAPLLQIQNGEFYDAYFERLAARWDPYFPELADLIRRNPFPERNTLWEEHGVEQVRDLNFKGAIDNESCVVTTVFVQSNRGDARYLNGDRRLFLDLSEKTHSRMSRAVLLLHERLYFEARRRLAHPDSAATRELVRLLITESPAATLLEFSDAMGAVGFGYLLETRGFSTVRRMVQAANAHLENAVKPSARDEEIDVRWRNEIMRAATAIYDRAFQDRGEVGAHNVFQCKWDDSIEACVWHGMKLVQEKASYNSEIQEELFPHLEYAVKELRYRLHVRALLALESTTNFLYDLVTNAIQEFKKTPEWAKTFGTLHEKFHSALWAVREELADPNPNRPWRSVEKFSLGSVPKGALSEGFHSLDHGYWWYVLPVEFPLSMPLNLGGSL